LLALGAPLHAQGRVQSRADGFLFAAPRAALTLRAGYAGADARSDLFAFTTDTLTLGRGDFGAPALAADLAFGRPGSRLDVVLGVGYAASRAPSEFRNWVDADDRPIEQTTTFRRVPLTASLKAYLLPRGRSVGRFAWIPARVAPYVGAGAGAMWYRFEQAGDFVDFETLDVFEDTFDTSGWGPMGQAMAGVDVSLGPRTAVTADARYVYAKAGVAGDFAGFDRIDLSGFATTVGVTFRF
jgi:hypothetical protein